MNFTLEDLIDLEAARIANAKYEAEEQLEIDEDFETLLTDSGDLPGQVKIFDK